MVEKLEVENGNPNFKSYVAVKLLFFIKSALTCLRNTNVNPESSSPGLFKIGKKLLSIRSRIRENHKNKVDPDLLDTLYYFINQLE